MLRAGSAGEGVKNRRNAPERKVRPLVINNLRQRVVAILDFFYAFGRSAFWVGDLLEPAREGESGYSHLNITNIVRKVSPEDVGRRARGIFNWTWPGPGSSLRFQHECGFD
jgi:hypothetical protein